MLGQFWLRSKQQGKDTNKLKVENCSDKGFEISCTFFSATYGLEVPH